MSRRRTCADVPVLQLKEDGCDEYEVLVQGRSLLQSGMPSVGYNAAAERPEGLTLFLNENAKQVLRHFLANYRKGRLEAM